ncbi:cupin domain-containing protein [Roseovarius nitratireducens]|uniref:cupin domain-containing protein n=1 Tax=Roseovarius nitratireducens TaxID=2044597 RepID=UPI000CE1769D|nr:cupin domain-containing protein [Roseovarius nitratireducens]
MPNTAKIIRFDPNGPANTGLEEWDAMDPATLVAGEPVQRGHIYHEDAGAGYLAGVWDCTAFTEPMQPYGVDEYMFLLEGTLVMGMPDGTDVTITAGQGFVIPKGLTCQWKQEGYLRKFFIILDPKLPDHADNPSRHRITVPELMIAGQGGQPVEASRVDFVNASGSMQVGLRDCAACDFAALPVTQNLLLQVIEGELTLTGTEDLQTFKKGEAAYVVAGGTLRWQTTDGTRLLQASYAG